VFENRVLKRIFGPKGNEVTGVWGKSYNQEFHHFNLSPEIVRLRISRRIKLPCI
jgi:hypothetical protein